MFISQKLIDNERSTLVPGSGVDTQKFSPITRRRGEDGVFRFLLASRMVWDKGIKEYAEAAKMIKQICKEKVEFLLLGPHTDKGKMNDVPEDLIRKWENEGAIVYGGVSNDMPSSIAKADVVVLPSFYREGIPRILLEALSMGKPIITTNHVGCKETVKDNENGFLVPIKSTSHLVTAFLKIMQLPETELEAMGKKSRQKALDEFDERIVIEKYLKKIDAHFQTLKNECFG